MEYMIKSTNEKVEILSVTRGWTTVLTSTGEEKKVRNGNLVKILKTSRIRHVKNASYNVENMRKLTSRFGNLSYDCGDSLARRLEGKSLDEVYMIASEELEISIEVLKNKYKHLNVGMQRMNLGNRMRAQNSRNLRVKAEILGVKNRV